MSVVDLTLDDSGEATEDEIAVLKSEGEGLPPSSNCHFNQIKTAPASPADSEDSRDELYSLADSWEDPNIATIELDVNHESDSAAESDSEVILIKPELAPKDFVVDESHLADGSPKPMVTIEPDSDLDLKKVVNVGEEPVYTIPEEESDDADDLDLKKVVNVGKEPVYTIPEEESDDADEPEFLTVEDNIIIESDSDGVESEASDYSVTDLRTYDCTFCDFSTEVEEWFHKHMDNHAPGTKPYVRVYCPDCIYSTGSLKFLFFHMMNVHRIFEPKFYRIGEKRYRCHHCHVSKELRIDIERHAAKHVVELKRPRELRLKYLCPLQICHFSSDDLEILPRHIKKSHNIGNPTCYRERNQYRLFYHCFKCSFTSPYKKKINEHSRKHYTDYELMQPYKFLCPSKSCKFSTRKDYRISRHLRSKHSASRAYYRVDSSKFKCFTCGVIKNSSKSMVFHCRKHLKKKR